MMRLRIISALNGTVMLRAFSTDRTEAMEWTVVQTPQKRWVKYQASRGSRPWRIFSIPRNMVLELQASVIVPPFTSAWIRRCPSMRVIGSTTIFAMAYSSLVVSSGSLSLRRAFRAPWMAKPAPAAATRPRPILSAVASMPKPGTLGSRR